jgi:hypothetical protein
VEHKGCDIQIREGEEAGIRGRAPSWRDHASRSSAYLSHFFTSASISKYLSINEIDEVTEENGIRLELLPIHTINLDGRHSGSRRQSIFWSCLLGRSKHATARR